MDLIGFAPLAMSLILQLLCLVELGETVVQGGVVCLVNSLEGLLLRRCVLNHLIRRRVVVLSKLLRMPFNRDETLFDKIFFKNWGICRQEDASTALLAPMAQRTSIACPIDGLQDEGRVDPIA